jgi:vacuole morphology and inheritance protein 14
MFVILEVSMCSQLSGHCSTWIDIDYIVWEPGQGVQIDYAAIVEILLMHVEGESDEILQSTSLRWLAEFLNVVPEVMVSFTPRLIGAVLPNLAHHAAMIQSTAQRTNKLLSKVIGKLPSPSSDVTSPPRTGVAEQPPAPVPTVGASRTATSPTPTPTPGVTRQSIGSAPLSRDMSIESLPDAGAMSTSKSRSNTVTSDATRTLAALDITSTVPLPPTNQIADPLRSHSPLSQMSAPPSTQHRNHGQLETELFDYSATVNALTIQFLSEHEETRVAALKWLIMLHQKAPKQVGCWVIQSCCSWLIFSQILAIDDGTFPALLKTLSDSSEEVHFSLYLSTECEF